MRVTVMREKIGNQNCDKNVLSYYILSSLVCQHFFLFCAGHQCLPKDFSWICAIPFPKNRGNDVSPQPQDSAVGFTPRFVAVN